MRVTPVFVALLMATSLSVQADGQIADREGTRSSPLTLGLFGFAARAGIDFEDQGQAVASVALDLGDLFTDRLRLRPSAEIGFGWGENTYVANVEIIYRLAADTYSVIPYIGGGIALAGQEGCGAIDSCPAIWGQFAIGAELPFRDQMNWIIEYHGENEFRRHRLLFGLTTRRGN